MVFESVPNRKNAFVTVVKSLEVVDVQLVIKPSQFNMRGCAGRQSGRCTPQLTAAQHMQADVDREAF
jgi:hypothetical protein